MSVFYTIRFLLRCLSANAFCIKVRTIPILDTFVIRLPFAMSRFVSAVYIMISLTTVL